MTNSTCSVLGCEQNVSAPRGWCWKHYNKYRRYGDPNGRFEKKKCSVGSCEADSRAGGMCDKHYRRHKTHGDASVGRPEYDPTCSAPKCSALSSTVGLCRSHYHQKWITEGRGAEVTAAARASRRARIANAPTIDRLLSWRTLWAEGHRACYLCGVECNPSDYQTRINKGGWQQHISGPTYPSLDHIQALVNGGAHARSNAALACRICNSKKHAKENYEAELLAPSQDARAGS